MEWPSASLLVRVHIVAIIRGGSALREAEEEICRLVRAIKTGDVMVEVVVDIGRQEVVAAITSSSVQRLSL